MTLDLFSRSASRPIVMQDADVSYLERMELGLSYDDALWRLVGEVPWEPWTFMLWGR